ncbi:MAG: Bug family tripartite tricarboxylate transporter substrate binding protein [Acetobacteraceae bacterium]
MTTRRLLLGAGLSALALPALAQAWPSRPIRVIDPGAAGGGNDIIIRLFQPRLEAALGQPIVVENRPGAGGRIGVEAAFRAAPDGTTFLLGNAGATGINQAIYRDLPYDLRTDFVPISLLVHGPNALVVNTRVLPVRSVQELIAYARARPGQLNYASGGIGSSAHMSMELFKARTGLDIVHVPYRGVPAMATAVASGEAPLMFANLTNVLPFVQRGDFALLAVTSAERWGQTPDVPTVAESGLPGFETWAWVGLMAPNGTDDAIIRRFHAALVPLREDATLRERIRGLGGELVISTPGQLRERMRRDVTQWLEVAERANIPRE